MKALTAIAAFVQRHDLAAMPPERFDRVKRHILDTWAAQIAGSQTDAGEAVSQLLEAGDTASAIVVRCAQARCTEVDDVHLTSCTTPGSVVVSTALALAAERAAAGDVISVRDFCAAVLAGYESLIRFGVAIDGPARLREGVWPTACVAAFGSAVTASRLLALDVEQTAGALATSLAFAQHRSVTGSPARSSRWLSLGIAAANGVLAARGALAGLSGAVADAAVPAKLTHGLGRRFLFDEIGMKPFPTARQGLAAIEAARRIVEQERLAPRDLQAIVVRLPEPQRAIVDRSGFPRTRFESIVNVRYQIALALIARDRLGDVQRTPLFDSPTVRRLMTTIRVVRARDLDARYPRSFPARVEISAGGRRHALLVVHPLGDAKRPLDWNAVAAKAKTMAAPVVGAAATDRLIAAWRAADADAPMPTFP